MHKVVLIVILGLLLFGCSSQKEVTKVSYSSKEDMKREAIAYFIDGSICDLKEDYEAAIKNYHRALQLDPQQSIYAALAQDYLALKRIPPAIRYSKLAVHMDTTNIKYLYLLANTFNAGFLIDSAAAIYKKIIFLDSTDFNAYYALAEIYEQSNPSEAAEYYKKVIEMVPGNNTVLFRLLNVYQNLNRYDEAISLIKELIRENPNYLLLYNYLSGLYFNSGEYEKALEIINQALDIRLNDPELLALRAEVYLNLNKDNEALKDYKVIAEDKSISAADKYNYFSLIVERSKDDNELIPEVIKLYKRLDSDTTSWEVKSILGTLYYMNEEDDEAIKYFKQVTDIESDNANAWFSLGNSLLNLRKYKEAEEYLRPAVTKFEDDFYINHLYGIILSFLGNFNDSKIYLVKADSIKGGDIFTLTALGYVYNQLGENGKAIDVYTEVLQLSPNEINAMGSLASIYSALNDHEESDSLYEKILTIDPKNPLYSNNYAYSLAQRGIDLNKALMMINNSLIAEPYNSSYLDTKGWVLFQLGNYKEAEALILKSLELDAENPEVLEHLGDVSIKLNKKNKALKYYKDALKILPDNKLLKEKIEGLN